MPSDLLVGRAVTVRDAAEADLDAITAIWNHEVLWTDATTDTEPRNARAEREWFERHPALYPIVVAATGGAVLAFGSLSPYRPKPAFARTVEDSVYVVRRHRGEGLGSLILSELPERHGLDGVAQSIVRIRAAFPDWHEAVDDLVEEGDRVVSRYTSRGTHRGPFWGIPPTGRTITVAEISIFRIASGRVAEQWCLVDELARMEQLGGVLERPGGATRPSLELLYEVSMDVEAHDVGPTPGGHRRIVV